MKIVNVNKEDVFKHLEKGIEVYSFDTASDSLENLRYIVVDEILRFIKCNSIVYFIVESEERKNGN